MDAVKYLISGVDPVRKDSAVPDGAMVLKDMFSSPEVFVDRMPTNPPTLSERRVRRGRLAGVIAVAAAAVATGVLLTMNLGPLADVPAPATSSSATAPAPSAVPTAATSPGLAPSPTAAQEPSASPESTASVPAAAPWRTYSSADGRISFDYPVDWTVLPKPANPEYPAVDLDVEDSGGKRIASLHYGASGGIGGACAAPVPYQVLDSVELPLPYNASASDVIAPRYAYRVLVEADRVIASYGITSSPAGKDGRACMLYNVVSGPAESPLYSFADNFQVSAGDAPGTNSKVFSSLTEARDYMLSTEYTNAKKMLVSLRIRSGK